MHIYLKIDDSIVSTSNSTQYGPLDQMELHHTISNC